MANIMCFRDYNTINMKKMSYINSTLIVRIFAIRKIDYSYI